MFLLVPWTFLIIRVAVAVSIMLAALTPVDAGALKRRALVIANAEYVHTTTLKNPANDAALIVARLLELGFDVQLEKDLNARRFSEIIQEFSASLESVRIWSVDNQEELARLFFQKNGEKYAGVTFDNQAFGDRNSGLVSVYVDGRQLNALDADRTVKYIGRGIVIIENEN
jgi:Caspase domain